MDGLEVYHGSRGIGSQTTLQTSTDLSQSRKPSYSTLNVNDISTAATSTVELVEKKGANAAQTGAREFPELPYSLRTRKKSIAFVFFLLLLDASILPLALFYILKYGAKLDDQKNIAITTAVFGFFSLLQYIYRSYSLLKPSSTARPLSSTSPSGMTPWYYFDFYHIQFSIGFAVITYFMVKATTPPADFRLLALPPSLLIAQCAPQVLFSAVCSHLKLRSPIRFSSMEVGEICAPAVYTITEDIVAVEGGGGIAFRRAWKRRYTESWRFNRHLVHMSYFWGVSGMIAGGGIIAMVMTIPKYIAYGIGWTAPFLWAGAMAYVTIRWTQRMLDIEMKEWEEGKWGNGPGGNNVSGTEV